MDINRIADALLIVTDNVGHYTAFQKTDQYIVWAEDTQADAVYADGRMQEQAIQGTIDYYTKTENDPNVEKIQTALNDADISFYLNSVQYEDDTRFIHYEWVWSI
jgi:hypothetical protein